MTDQQQPATRRSGAVSRALEALETDSGPRLKQTFVALLITLAALLSAFTPWLIVSDAVAMWSGVAVALAALVLASLMARRPALLRWELAIPAADFVAVGLLRYGTGDSRSVFLPIVILTVVWIAAWPGRRNIVFPLLGTCVTLLMPYLFDPTGPGPSELVRLAFVLMVYATLAVAVNELSRQADLRLDRSRARRRAAQGELDRAALVQQSLLPPDASTLPTSFRVFGACVPARTVGGDFFDWYPAGGGMALTLGDVMGKGVGAGMIAAAVRSVIRSAVDEPDPATALRRSAVGIATSDSSSETQFTTCFHARIDHDGVIHWVDAGHGLALLRRANGTVERLRSPNLPIGIGTDWTTFRTTAAAGDTLVVVSDGVLDLYDDELEALNLFEALLVRTPDAAAIVTAVADLASEEERPDDVTVVAATFTPAPVPVQPVG
ncbi:PP2C family protein-serine/threonine phosphatase [Frigoribacterium faeni]|uniref:Serine phosphatase RsbU (Regulator of sigma subunit) n=1 Tax=Frigoribacterium faeni TaxID=145483 RepID=A0A7W3JK70_9MICO|nr:PP2C family protein-serine/threonine phosphatase [Frigoribacterium faeni]MBA8814285.1 serine phosphatase RsbU (regulator of sigma subunit) [Frigoribacterium faeni]